MNPAADGPPEKVPRRKRAAVCFFGITRNLNRRTLESIERQIFAPMAEFDPSFTKFAHFNLVSHISNERSKENAVGLSLDDHKLLHCDQVRTTPQAKVDALIDLAPFAPFGDPWRDSFASMRNLLRQYYSLQEVTKLLVESGTKFDLVLFTRADLRFQSRLIIPELAPATLYTPRFANWGGLNDRLALGDQETMVQYGNRGAAAAQYCAEEQKALHAEQFLKWYVDQCEFSQVDLDLSFQRIRADGRVAPLDGHARWLYALRSKLLQLSNRS